jgi:glucose-6-phosphate isomerase
MEVKMLKIDLKNMKQAPSDWSEVFDYRENIDKLNLQLEEFKNYKKLIVIGNGGSITSYDAYYGAINPQKKSATVWTMEPDYINNIQKDFSPEDTIVIAISKSGNTLGLIEALCAFNNYKTLVVTSPESGTLSEIANIMGWKIIPHPPVGGRFSGGTSSAFTPCKIAGIDTKKIQAGLEDGYKLKDLAYSLSKYYFDLEKQGYNEVYIPIYSNSLRAFQNMIIQLMHESVCKNSKGQTFYTALSPEAQHHTNQRFLGGKKNVIGTFIIVKNPTNKITISLDEKIKNLSYKSGNLNSIDGLNLQAGLLAEYHGTKLDADEKNVPNVTIELDEICEQSAGELLAFWHLVAFYSALIRGVNPFDQPAVERSKNITFEEITKKK